MHLFRPLLRQAGPTVFQFRFEHDRRPSFVHELATWRLRACGLVCTALLARARRRSGSWHGVGVGTFTSFLLRWVLQAEVALERVEVSERDKLVVLKSANHDAGGDSEFGGKAFDRFGRKRTLLAQLSEGGLRD